MLTSERLKSAALKAKEKSVKARNDLIDAIRCQVEDSLVDFFENIPTNKIPYDATGVTFELSNVSATPGTTTVDLAIAITFTSGENACNMPAEFKHVIMHLEIVDSNGNTLCREIFNKEDFSPKAVFLMNSDVRPISFTEIFGDGKMYIDLSGDEQL